MIKRFPIIALLVLLFGCAAPVHHQVVAPRAQWTRTQAANWYVSKPWPVGCNFIPSTAINQLEMWQAETWDPATIDRELGWAESLGFNTVRVFLHDIPWRQDSRGFLKRMDQFLDIAHKHHVGVMFVLLDSVWDPFPKAGKQPEPQPHVHNSGWVQCPGKAILCDPSRHEELKPYIQGVIGHFRNDKRIDCWDIFNEPDNLNGSGYRKYEQENKPEMALVLIKKAYAWAREMNPSQPLTSAPWLNSADPARLSAMDKFQIEESDVISFHCYTDLKGTQAWVRNLQRYGRPILCSEYMARPMGSRFNPVLGYFKDQRVGAYNWGFVSGKTQTIYPWDSWEKTYTDEPKIWFHDIFHADGEPYDLKEVSYIRSMTGKEIKSR